MVKNYVDNTSFANDRFTLQRLWLIPLTLEMFTLRKKNQTIEARRGASLLNSRFWCRHAPHRALRATLKTTVWQTNAAQASCEITFSLVCEQKY